LPRGGTFKLLPFLSGSEELNVLKSHLRITIETLLAKGVSQHEIARRTGVDRKTIRRYQSNSPMATGSVSGEGQNPLPRPPALPKPASSACEPHRIWIEEQVGLGRNATSIYQDLVELFGFEHRYNSVKRFVRGLKVRDPERFDVLESLPGEEAQVDFGQGAPTLKGNGRYSRPFLFVMTLKYSQVVPKSRLESRPGDLGPTARGRLPDLRWIGGLCGPRQPEVRRDPAGSLRARDQRRLCGVFGALRRRRRYLPGRRSDTKPISRPNLGLSARRGRHSSRDSKYASA
jgi:hypothetical protein